MIELEFKHNYLGQKLYFKNTKDCEEYLYVFKDHMCNVPWEKPVEISDGTSIDYYDELSLKMPPKERALHDLKWGFNIVDTLGIVLTDEQNNFIKSMI